MLQDRYPIDDGASRLPRDVKMAEQTTYYTIGGGLPVVDLLAIDAG